MIYYAARPEHARPLRHDQPYIDGSTGSIACAMQTPVELHPCRAACSPLATEAQRIPVWPVACQASLDRSCSLFGVAMPRAVPPVWVEIGMVLTYTQSVSTQGSNQTHRIRPLSALSTAPIHDPRIPRPLPSHAHSHSIVSHCQCCSCVRAGPSIRPRLHLTGGPPPDGASHVLVISPPHNRPSFLRSCYEQPIERGARLRCDGLVG